MLEFPFEFKQGSSGIETHCFGCLNKSKFGQIGPFTIRFDAELILQSLYSTVYRNFNQEVKSNEPTNRIR